MSSWLFLLAAAPPPPPPGGVGSFSFSRFFSQKKRKNCASSGEHEQCSEALAQAARERRVHSNAFLVRRSSAKRETGNKRENNFKKRDQPLGPGPHILVPTLEGYYM